MEVRAVVQEEHHVGVVHHVLAYLQVLVAAAALDDEVLKAVGLVEQLVELLHRLLVEEGGLVLALVKGEGHDEARLRIHLPHRPGEDAVRAVCQGGDGQERDLPILRHQVIPHAPDLLDQEGV